MKSDDIVSGNLVGIFLSLGLFGFYTCLFSFTIWRARHQWRKFTFPLAAVTVIYVINVIEIVSSCVKGHRAFVSAEGTSEYLRGHDALLLDSLNAFCFLIASVTAYAVIWWRLYVIWSRDLRILVIPVIGLLLGAIGGCFIVAYGILMSSNGVTGYYQSKLKMWIDISFGSELGSNWLVTIAILWGLYRAGRRMKSNRWADVIRAIVESGVIWSVTICVYLGLSASGNVAGTAVVGYSLSQIAGIVSTLILLQLNLDHTHTQRPSIRAPPRTSTRPPPLALDPVLDIRRESHLSNAVTVTPRPTTRVVRPPEDAPSIATGYSFSFNESGVIIPTGDPDKTDATPNTDVSYLELSQHAPRDFHLQPEIEDLEAARASSMGH